MATWRVNLPNDYPLQTPPAPYWWVICCIHGCNPGPGKGGWVMIARGSGRTKLWVTADNEACMYDAWRKIDSNVAATTYSARPPCKREFEGSSRGVQGEFKGSIRGVSLRTNSLAMSP